MRAPRTRLGRRFLKSSSNSTGKEVFESSSNSPRKDVLRDPQTRLGRRSLGGRQDLRHAATTRSEIREGEIQQVGEFKAWADGKIREV